MEAYSFHPSSNSEPPGFFHSTLGFSSTALVPSEVTHLSDNLCTLCLCPRLRAPRRKNIISMLVEGRKAIRRKERRKGGKMEGRKESRENIGSGLLPGTNTTRSRTLTEPRPSAIFPGAQAFPWASISSFYLCEGVLWLICGHLLRVRTAVRTVFVFLWILSLVRHCLVPGLPSVHLSMACTQRSRPLDGMTQPAILHLSMWPLWESPPRSGC